MVLVKHLVQFEARELELAKEFEAQSGQVIALVVELMETLEPAKQLVVNPLLGSHTIPKVPVHFLQTPPTPKLYHPAGQATQLAAAEGKNSRPAPIVQFVAMTVQVP